MNLSSKQRTFDFKNGSDKLIIVIFICAFNFVDRAHYVW